MSKELRCLVCQNQSIDDSDASLARDLRAVVRARLSAGDSDAQVLQYVADRYGEYALLRPRMGPATILLWATPLLLIALFLAYLLTRATRTENDVDPLSDEERERLDQILDRS